MAKRQSKDAMYLLKGIPQATWDQAKAKAAAERPPLSMKWVLIALLEKWVGPPPDTGQSIPPTPPADKAKRAKKPKAEPTANFQPPTPKASAPASVPSAPDLGDSF